MINLTITAQADGTGEEHGMALAELERTCALLRANGGADDTQLDVRTNRAHRIRSITAVELNAGGEIRPPFAEHPPAPRDPSDEAVALTGPSSAGHPDRGDDDLAPGQ